MDKKKYLQEILNQIKNTISFISQNLTFNLVYTCIKFFFIFLGILFIGFQIYSRIILERSPKDLSVFSISLFLVSITVISIQLYLLRKYINKLLGKTQSIL